MLTAMRTLAVCRRATLQLPRAATSARALRALCAATPLPGRRPAQPPQPRTLATGRVLPRAAAVEAPAASSPAAGSSKGTAGSAPTFQEAIARLQDYWASVGCALWLPHNTEVRARLRHGSHAHGRSEEVLVAARCMGRRHMSWLVRARI